MARRASPTPKSYRQRQQSAALDKNTCSYYHPPKLTPTGAWRAWAGIHTPQDRPPVLGEANGPGRRPRSPLASAGRAATSRNPRRRPALPASPTPTLSNCSPPPTLGRVPSGWRPGVGAILTTEPLSPPPNQRTPDPRRTPRRRPVSKLKARNRHRSSLCSRYTRSNPSRARGISAPSCSSALRSVARVSGFVAAV